MADEEKDPKAQGDNGTPAPAEDTKPKDAPPADDSTPSDDKPKDQPSGEDRKTELSRIAKKFGAEVLQLAVLEDLTYEQASERAYDLQQEEIKALRKQQAKPAADPEGADPLSGGEDTPPPSEEASAYQRNLPAGVSAQAEHFAKVLGGK